VLLVHLYLLNFFRWIRENLFVWGFFGMISTLTAALLLQPIVERLFGFDSGLGRVWFIVVLLISLPMGQNVLNLLYMWLAHAASKGPVSELTTGLIICGEQFGAGLGTAVFMVYILRCCDPAHKAAHMAILTALMSLSFTIAGVMSGFLAEALGFTLYFGVSFIATAPAMVLIFFIPHLDGREKTA